MSNNSAPQNTFRLLKRPGSVDTWGKERHTNQTSELYYLRTSHGVEIDLIIDRKNTKEFIEIKNSATFNPRMVAPMNEFIEKGDKGFLLYRGENFPYYEPIKVLHYKEFLG